MRYDFKCSKCSHEQTVVFSVNDYDTLVNHEGLLLDVPCESCNEIALLRNITQPPQALGGNKGYVSIERYLSKNKGQQIDNERRALRDIRKRHEKNIKGMHDRLKDE